MKFITTTSDKVSSIEVSSGQLILSRDNRVIYLDSSAGRTEYNTIIVLSTEDLRLHTIPVTGFYFVTETAILWRYENNTWKQLTNTPDRRLVFCDYEELPVIGTGETLYCTQNAIYQWDANTSTYVKMSGSGTSTWEPIPSISI